MPLGPIWINRISCFAKILPFSVNRTKKTESKLLKVKHNSILMKQTTLEGLTMANHKGATNCHWTHIEILAWLLHHGRHREIAHPETK